MLIAVFKGRRFLGGIMLTIARLKNTQIKYAWGSTTAIQELVGEKNYRPEPVAELWMGAHPKAPSLVRHQEQWLPLIDIIAANPQTILGSGVADKFQNCLPFLFKVLAAAKPLSIQAHPSRDLAVKGFENENRENIPLNADNRNYKDANHKPECLCALSPFWALCGFRPIDDIAFLVGQICPVGLKREVDQLNNQPDPGGLEAFFSALFFMDPGRKKPVIGEALQNARLRSAENPAFDWMAKLNREYPHDIGILSPLFLNLIRLMPGQALFLPAGELHAYLEGLGIELMANSDNVLRGGLTSKYIDEDELLKVLSFKPRPVEILEAAHGHEAESIYPSFAEEFVLSVITVSRDEFYREPDLRSAQILLCTQGRAHVEVGGGHEALSLHKGESAFISAAAGTCTIRGEAVLYKAAVPV